MKPVKFRRFEYFSYMLCCNLEAVCSKFPFPQGGTPNEPEVASVAIDHLRMAEKTEKEGVQLLEQLQSINSAKTSSAMHNASQTER